MDNWGNVCWKRDDAVAIDGRNFVCDFSSACPFADQEAPNSCGKRVLPFGDSVDGLPFKRTNFSEVSSLSRKRTADFENDPMMTKRWRLMQANQNKRHLEEGNGGTELRANKKLVPNREEESLLAMVVSQPDRVTLLDECDDSPWFGSVELSRVPKSVFAETKQDQQLVLYEDPQMHLKRLFRKQRDAHPPLLAAQNVEPPRVEILSSDDEIDENNEKQQIDNDDDDDGIVPMDCSD
jgi:hypothetical protein